VNLTIHTTRDTLYLTIPIEGLTPREARRVLAPEARARGAKPARRLERAGILGESNGPTLYCLKATLLPNQVKKAA
jgi:hypothetical protein